MRNATQRHILWSNGKETVEQITPWTMKDRKAAQKEEQKFIDCGFEAVEIRFEGGRSC